MVRLQGAHMKLTENAFFTQLTVYLSNLIFFLSPKDLESRLGTASPLLFESCYEADVHVCIMHTPYASTSPSYSQ